MRNASDELYTALHRRAYFNEIIIMLPSSWPATCLPSNHHSSNTILTSSGETSDITISIEHPIYQHNIWTEQYGGCYVQGKQIYAGYDAFNTEKAGRQFVNEWVKYRYGVFDEIGFQADPIYPKCWHLDDDLTENG